jgi:hypothetical protein
MLVSTDFRAFCISFCVLVFGFSHHAYTQEFRQNIQGWVVDRDTKRPLSGVEITVKSNDTLASTLSDTLGFFHFKALPIGRYDLYGRKEGFAPYSVRQFQLNTGKELVFQLEITEQLTEIKEVRVMPHRDKTRLVNDMAVVSARTFNVEETQRYAASFNDPARMAISFAGVNTSDDASNEIVVRGNSARGMLWRIEGIEVPSPNHFSNGEGGSGGGISMLSSQVIGTSDFFTGAFPAEYGNALSGVFDIRFRKGNSSKREYALQVGILGMQACLEGPFKKNYPGSYLINYRYSTLTMLNAIGLPIVDNALVPQFQDLSFNIHLPTRNRQHTFTLWGLGGLSIAGDLAVKDSSTWTRPEDRFEDRSRQLLGIAGATHTYRLKNQKSYVKTVFALSSDDTRYQLDSLSSTYHPERIYEEKFGYSAIRINSFLHHKWNSKHILRAGIIGSNLAYSLFSGSISQNGQSFNALLNERGSTFLFQGYAQWKWALSDELDIHSGLHGTYLALNGNKAVEPRMAIQWRFASRQSISLGAGMHSRAEPISVYMSKVTNALGESLQANKDLPLSRSAHLVLSHDWTINPNLRLKTEMYFQYLNRLPSDTLNGNNECLVNASAGLVRNPLFSTGEGKNYGLELTLERFFANRFFFLFTTSLFESTYSVDKSTWYSTRFNAHYMFNLLGGYEWVFGSKKQSSLNINSRFTWRGGNRYTPIDLDASLQQGTEVKITDLAYSEKVADYLRLDVSSALRFNFERWAFIFSLEIQNVTNRLNISRYAFDPFTSTIRTNYMFGIMPVFNFKIEF